MRQIYRSASSAPRSHCWLRSAVCWDTARVIHNVPGRDPMTPITRGQRIYFAAVGAFAMLVGVWGYFLPSRIDQVIPWLLPPLHARFLGAMYLSGATFMLGCFLARRYAEARV